MSNTITLQKDREKSLLRRHPWVFSKAVDKVKGKPEAGAPVEILDHKGNWIARGAWSPASQIRVRVWTFDQNEQIDTDFFIRRLEQAQAGREHLISRLQLSAYRLVAAESDFLPGITIDRYNDYLVCQLLSAGAEYHKNELMEALKTLYPSCHIYERRNNFV